MESGQLVDARTVDRLGQSSSSKASTSKKRKRFTNVDEREYFPVPFVDFPVGLSRSEADQFLREQRLEVLLEKIRAGEIEIPDFGIRPPSPPPVFDRKGARANSVEARYSLSMQREFSNLVYWMTKHITGYTPPAEYRPPMFSKRLFLPTDQYPEINFVGLVIGPKGTTLRRLQEESGCSLNIRGIGSKRDDRHNPQTDEEARMPTHVFILANDEDKVKKAMQVLEPLIDPLHPDHELERLKGLEQLALVSGGNIRDTLTARQLRLWEGDGNFDEGEYEMANVQCRICGDRGHPTVDCPRNRMSREQEIDAWRSEREFKEFLTELNVPEKPKETFENPEEERLKRLMPMIGAAIVTKELSQSLVPSSGASFHPLSFQASATRQARPASAAAAEAAPEPPWRRLKPSGAALPPGMFVIPETGFPPRS
jgi:Splicing factor 1 helix-hairpin domain/KH domain